TYLAMADKRGFINAQEVNIQKNAVGGIHSPKGIQDLDETETNKLKKNHISPNFQSKTNNIKIKQPKNITKLFSK
ncbi:hypothetical protein NAI50_10895, partial [Francisella tularensis subsp. holarctica]|nr:hypothetical protein [Francisella tularensis subsp. holarctica]